MIRAGDVVAFPTETVYGLGCDAFNAQAVARIFAVKQRPAFDPLIVHVEGRAMLSALTADIPSKAERLIDAFWPGPLTLVLSKLPQVPNNVTAGLPTVAVRMPAHQAAMALLRMAGCPIAAPSANPFGYVSPTTAEHVCDGLGEQVGLVLDGGPCNVGVESTILSLVGTHPEVLRPGSISLEDLRDVLGPDVRLAGSGPLSPMPGTATRHYATRTPVTVLSRPGERPSVPSGRRVGLLALSATDGLDDRFAVVEILSASGNLQDIAGDCLQPYVGWTGNTSTICMSNRANRRDSARRSWTGFGAAPPAPSPVKDCGQYQPLPPSDLPFQIEETT